MTDPTISQDAREHAAMLAEKLGEAIFLGGNDLAAIRNGTWDNETESGDVLSYFVQAFARFEAHLRTPATDTEAMRALNLVRNLPDAGGPAMLAAGKTALFSCSEDPEIEDARKCWHAMVDAAIDALAKGGA